MSDSPDSGRFICPQVVERDPDARNIPCIFCAATKERNPEREFATDGRNAVCTVCLSEASGLVAAAARGAAGCAYQLSLDFRRKTSAYVCGND